MRNILFLPVLGLLVNFTAACTDRDEKKVNTTSENRVQGTVGLEQRLAQLEAGDVLMLEDGNYENVQLIVTASGTETEPNRRQMPC